MKSGTSRADPPMEANKGQETHKERYTSLINKTSREEIESMTHELKTRDRRYTTNIAKRQ